jgi:hypothetical protein
MIVALLRGLTMHYRAWPFIFICAVAAFAALTTGGRWTSTSQAVDTIVVAGGCDPQVSRCQ